MNMINISVAGGVPSPVEGACGALTIGNVGDNGATGVALDFSVWAEEYGAGAVTLGVRRKGDAAWYPVALTVTDAEAVWIVSNVDTAVYGIGEARFAYTVGEVEKRSAVFRFFVDRGLGAPEGTPPDPYEDWVERLEILGAETLQNAQDAAESAAEAQGYAGDAETAKKAAEASQGAAEKAVEHYPKIVDGFWYVWIGGQWVDTGVQAKCEDGATFIPSVSADGDISWRNDKGYDNPETRNIRGPQGIQGPQGEKGDTGESGVTTPVNAFFTMAVDSNGDLYVYYADGGSAPEFEYDSVSGNLYFVTEG